MQRARINSTISRTLAFPIKWSVEEIHLPIRIQNLVSGKLANINCGRFTWSYVLLRIRPQSVIQIGNNIWLWSFGKFLTDIWPLASVSTCNHSDRQVASVCKAKNVIKGCNVKRIFSRTCFLEVRISLCKWDRYGCFIEALLRLILYNSEVPVIITHSLGLINECILSRVAVNSADESFLFGCRNKQSDAISAFFNFQ